MLPRIFNLYFAYPQAKLFEKMPHLLYNAHIVTTISRTALWISVSHPRSKDGEHNPANVPLKLG